jgi:2',3'-cyclic-nucleotide 2'-phosphodiesterase/3'-nucleotidase
MVKGHAPLKDAVQDYLVSSNGEDVRAMRPWSFASGTEVSAVLLTAAEARHHLDDIAHLAPESLGMTDDGFLRLRLHL